MSEQPWYALKVRPPFEMLALKGAAGVLVREASNNNAVLSAQLLKGFVSLSIDQWSIESV